jgi:signal transduction histidine kinase
MGTHGAVSARTRAVTAGNRASKSTDASPGGSQFLNLSNWPVSRRLFAVIVLALVMGLVFGGLRISSAESSASQFGRVSQLATLGQRLTVLIQDLQDERDQTLTYLAASNAAPLATAYARTDAAVSAVQGVTAGIGSGFPVNIQNGVTTVNADISGTRLKSLHNTLNPQAPQDELAVIANYGAVISDMITLADQVAQGVSDASLTSDVRAFNALALAKEQLSQQRALLNYSFSNPGDTSPANVFVDQNTELALQIASQEEFSDESAFQQAATPAERAFLASTLSSSAAATSVASAQNIETNVIANEGSVTGQSGSPLGLSILGAEDSTSTTPTAANLKQGSTVWDAGMGVDIAALQNTETLLANNIANRASQLHSGAQQSALITGVITAVVLLLVLLAALLVARSLVLPLRRLRSGALDVASVQLPERVRRLSESPDPAADLEVAPIPVLSGDEIGQVARAFDQVHSEAVRLAGNEAVLRTSFNAMFVNLSRRSQSLIERLARMIDSLEQNEDDPDRLSNLFSMDHLVTRMRRNSENLLLLAGHESPRKWTEPVPLADVTRAATSEIEQYARVVLNVQPGVAVVGPAVSDVVHLLAELIENATIFSPKDSPVQVSAQELTSGGVLIEVTDRGIGVSESRLAEMNWRLDNPPVMDVSVSRHMGLFAVARLAERHRIRIRLRPASPQGLTALVWLPDTVIERSARTFSGTGSWQAPAPAAQSGGFLQSRRPSGVHSVAGTAAGQHSSGRHSLARAEESTAMQGGVALPEQTSTATSNWFRSRHTVLGAQSRMPVNGGGTGNATDYGNGNGADYGNGNGADYGSGNGADYGGGAAAGGLPTRTPGQQQPGGWGTDSGAGWGASDTGSWGAADTGGWNTGGRRPADIIADPVQGDQTSAGLPLRVPKANLIPGSAPGARNGGGAPGGGAPGGGTGLPSRLGGNSNEAHTLSAQLPQRSPDMARSRLSGFQRGARRAESQPPRAGEGTDR